ncbi:hypothetical protein [Pseudothioclava nitratireducens]|jgi:hypothetical protein|uniref:hypothetical protein n=1 Tax=Pseudothioclava nitratireducens TaxID=1928646 RepID=UPI0023DAEB95|nr:hypothetical protein [Defluviimonas nitratireducens]MDF1620647.1 hypothetical protein [Defluviimonas nitratireducens]
MKWHHVQDNWHAFYEAIMDRWPEAEEADLDEIDGDQRDFVAYIAGLNDQSAAEAREEIREWITGELPSDVVMDPSHDNHSITNSAKYVPDGEDEYDDDARFGDGT